MSLQNIQRVLIANRGEIAIRIIRACKQLGLTAIAIYSETDQNALHVKLADEAYCIGPAAPSESYLNISRIIECAKKVRANAVHPGYGFLSERAAFAEAVTKSGLIFIGPDSDVITTMGSKVAARKLAESLKIPVLPGTQEPISEWAEVEALSKKIGYPLLLKASAGGGGKGMRLVTKSADLKSAFDLAQSEAQNAFGDPSLLIERFLEKPHHVEVQVLGDSHGNVVHLFERECSLQRRHQKLIEEAPSPFISEKTRKDLCAAAVKIAKAVNYVSAGTVECLVDNHGDWYFLEMNTRIQVEHPVTEMTTGIDLVEWQLRIATGEKLPWKQSDIQCNGAAIECRIYAEDPMTHFMPSPGTIQGYQEPSGPGVRIDSGVTYKSIVPMNYDPILAKLITWGSTRNEARERMQQAISEYIIAGIFTTLPLHKLMMSEPDFIAGAIHTQWLDDKLSSVLANIPPICPILIALSAFHQTQRGPTADISSDMSSTWEATSRLEGLRQ